MRRFYTYMRLGYPANKETAIAEGVQFSNGNVVLFEYLTTTVLVLDDVTAIYRHYAASGDVFIDWVDIDRTRLEIN